jgi:hypothetical protein
MENYKRVLGYINQDKFTREMYKVYKENNSLNLYLNYYANYLGADYIVEQQCSLVALVKMFLYAYTLEEKDGKSFYSFMNNDFRSGNANKISRYLTMLRSTYDLIRSKCLMSYNGDVYRATYFKQELINEIREVANKSINVNTAHDIKVDYLGAYATVTLHIELDGDMSLNESHKLAHIVQESIVKEIPIVKSATVHTCPIGLEYNHDQEIDKL